MNREPNNGRGPVDSAVSDGSKDKSLIVFKLEELKVGAEPSKPVAGLQAGNNGARGVNVIIFYTEEEGERVKRIVYLFSGFRSGTSADTTTQIMAVSAKIVSVSIRSLHRIQQPPPLSARPRVLSIC